MECMINKTYRNVCRHILIEVFSDCIIKIVRNKKKNQKNRIESLMQIIRKISFRACAPGRSTHKPWIIKAFTFMFGVALIP